MALSKNAFRRIERALGLNFTVASGATLYKGGYAGLRTQGHATSQGDAIPFGSESSVAPLGGFFDTAGEAPGTGDGVTVNIEDKIVLDVDVVGAASAADVLKPVFLTDDNTFTLARPPKAAIVGVIVKWHAGTTCDVLLFGLSTLIAIGLTGSGKTVLHMGTFDFGSVANGDLRTGFPAPFHGKVLSVFAHADQALVGAGGTIDVSLEIGDVGVTGGVVTVSTAALSTAGARADGTAVTAANEFHEGDAIDVVGALAGGTRTSGVVSLYALVERMPGA